MPIQRPTIGQRLRAIRYAARGIALDAVAAARLVRDSVCAHVATLDAMMSSPSESADPGTRAPDAGGGSSSPSDWEMDASGAVDIDAPVPLKPAEPIGPPGYFRGLGGVWLCTNCAKPRGEPHSSRCMDWRSS